MTTITFRDGLLASDTRISLGDMPAGNTRKLYNINGYCVAAAGERSEIEPFFKWLREGADLFEKPTWPKDTKTGFSAIVIGACQLPAVWYCWSTESGSLIVDEVIAPYFSIGSGKYFAIGAMAHGASSVEAVRAAMKCDPWTGGDVEVMHVRDGSIDVVV